MTAPAITWRVERAAVERQRAMANALPADCTPEEEASIEAYLVAADNLIEQTPAPSHEALIYKVQLAFERAGSEGIFDDHKAAILADISRLNFGPEHHEISPMTYALRVWRACRSAELSPDVLGGGGDEDIMDAMSDATVAALGRVMALPAENLAEAHAKAAVLLEMYDDSIGVPENYETVMRDLVRLTEQAA